MRRYKIVACIFLILSVVGFVHAAPVAVQEVRGACADAVDGGENVIIGLEKRAETEEEGSSSAPKYASGNDPNPSFSSGESKSPLFPTSGGTELSWNPEGDAKLIQPGTSTEFQPPSPSKAKSVSWASSKEVQMPSGLIYSEMLPPRPQPEGHQPKMAAQQMSSPPEPQSENIFSKLFGKLKFKFWRRISPAVL